MSKKKRLCHLLGAKDGHPRRRAAEILDFANGHLHAAHESLGEAVTALVQRAAASEREVARLRDELTTAAKCIIMADARAEKTSRPPNRTTFAPYDTRTPVRAAVARGIETWEKNTGGTIPNSASDLITAIAYEVAGLANGDDRIGAEIECIQRAKQQRIDDAMKAGDAARIEGCRTKAE